MLEKVSVMFRDGGGLDDLPIAQANWTLGVGLGLEDLPKVGLK